MSPEQAEWVREHIWTSAMRKTFAETPGYFLTCACQWAGPCLNDRAPGRHDRCHVGVPLPRYETVIIRRDGQSVACFRESYRYPTASATGWHHDHVAMVWLADRRCRWHCACDCGHPRGDIAHAPQRNPMRPIRYEVVELPGLLDEVPA